MNDGCVISRELSTSETMGIDIWGADIMVVLGRRYVTLSALVEKRKTERTKEKKQKTTAFPYWERYRISLVLVWLDRKEKLLQLRLIRLFFCRKSKYCKNAVVSAGDGELHLPDPFIRSRIRLKVNFWAEYTTCCNLVFLLWDWLPYLG